jgi:hypothetical protein
MAKRRYMDQIIAECDCPTPNACRRAGACLVAEELDKAKAEHNWQHMAQRERFEEDPARAFDEACDRIDKLTELVMRLAGVCYGELDERLKIIAEAERMNDAQH